MLRHLLETRRDAKNVVIADAGLGREYRGDGRPAFRQRSRLVENDHVDLASALQRLAVFYEDAAARAHPRAHHDPRRRRPANQTWTRNQHPANPPPEPLPHTLPPPIPAHSAP